MRAVIDVAGSLRLVQVPDPIPGPDEVLLEVRATALNRADLHQRRGRYPPPPGASEILGLEAAGVVRSDGGGEFRPGTPACALLTGGGYGELVAVPRDMLMAIPEGWSWAQAAAFPEASFTAYLNLFIEGGLRAGESLLIHAGASGVGTAAIQLAGAAGCRVYATAGTDEKVEACRRLGAHGAVNYRSEDFSVAVTEQVGHDAGDPTTDPANDPASAPGTEAGIDVILDMVGASYLERNLGLLRTGGRLVVIATLGGREATLDLALLMRKRATLRGSTLRSRPLAEKVGIKEALWRHFGDDFRAGRIVPPIDSVYPVERAEEAHERMAANLNVGKIVLQFGVPEAPL